MWEHAVRMDAQRGPPRDRPYDPMTEPLPSDDHTKLAYIAFASGSAWSDLAAMWFVRGFVGRAISCYRRSLHWDAGNIASHAGLISMLQQLGLRDDSCDLLIRLMNARQI